MTPRSKPVTGIHGGGVPLTPAEWRVLEAYRALEKNGTGQLYVEFVQHRCTRFEQKVNDAPVLNTLLDSSKPTVLRD